MDVTQRGKLRGAVDTLLTVHTRQDVHDEMMIMAGAYPDHFNGVSESHYFEAWNTLKKFREGAL